VNLAVVPARQQHVGDVIALADDYWRLAQRISATEFVPKALRQRPEAVLAALLSGAERGLGPMEALRSVHVIEGRPSLSAEAMRALVFAAGHTIEIIETTAARCTVVGRRAGTETTSPPFTWTMDRARRAKLTGKDNWQKYPEAMLLARATADLCRALFPDVTAGLAVTEEITDEIVVEQPATTRRRRKPTPQAPALPARTPAGDATTKEEEVGTSPAASVELDDIPDADTPTWGQPAGTTATAMTRRIHAEIGDAFPDTDDQIRDRYRHALVAVVTRQRPDGPVASSTELTVEEQLTLSRMLATIRAGITSVTDGPDGQIEIRHDSGWHAAVNLDPLSVTVPTPTGDDTADAAWVDAAKSEPEQPTLDEEDA
jgi:hypothetical protein